MEGTCIRDLNKWIWKCMYVCMYDICTIIIDMLFFVGAHI